MTRNLDRRVELMFPVENAAARASILHALRAMFRDNVKARVLGPDGTYVRAAPGPNESRCRVQVLLQDEAQRRAAQAIERAGVTFRPAPGASPATGS
jgi:polyphosphate kinase